MPARPPQDGTISFEAKLSGILSTSIASLGEVSPTFGVRVAPGVNVSGSKARFS